MSVSTELTIFGVPVEALRAKLARAPWAAPVYEKVRASVLEWRTRGITIPGPEVESGWGHNFTCPDCAVLLIYDMDAPGAHRCPRCGGVFSDRDRDAAWVYYRNLLQIHAAESACIVAALDGDGDTLAMARETLLGYTRNYPDYEEHGRWAGKGRIQPQSLCEAVWMIPAVRVFHALNALGALSDTEQATVIEDMFLPAAALLRRQTSMIHNIHVWHCSAIYAIAVAAGDEDYRAFAEEHLRRNLLEGVLPDGSWYEGSPHYHFYTAEAFSHYLLAARAAGLPVVEPERLERMFRSPLLMLQPDLQFPAINDGWPENPLASRAAIYEVANYLFGGFDDALHLIYGRGGAERASVQALLYGAETIAPETLRLPSAVHVDGVAVVRRGPLVGYVKATPHGGGHDHPDKPSLYLLSTRGGPKAADLGNPGYGNPMHRAYYRTTVTHNTVLVDGADQRLSTASITELIEGDDYTRVTAVADGAYEGVTLARTTLFGDGWALDWTRGVSESEHSWLWLFHASGPLFIDGASAGEARTFVDNPYVEEQTAYPAVEGARGEWRDRDGGPATLAFRLWSVGGVDPFLASAIMPDIPATERVGLLAAGASGRRFDVLSAFAVPGGVLPDITVVARAPEGIVVEIAPLGGKPFVVQISARREEPS